MAKYTFKDFSEDVFKTVKRPLGAVDIWKEGKKLGLDQKLGSNGETPWQTIGAQIYVDIKKGNSKFQQVSKKPVLFSLTNQKVSAKDIEESISVDEKDTGFKERDLHPVLVKYLYSNPQFKCLTKTIFHEYSKRSKKNVDKWIHPDLIGVYFPFEDYDSRTLNACNLLKEKTYKIFSFEMKRNITTANLREYYFQAVSNSSWANEGYLVAPYISDDDLLLSELSLLNNAFGIGVIKLDIQFPEQSKILFYAKSKTNIDIDMLDKLMEKNKHVQDVFDALVDSNRLGKIVEREKFDEVLSDEAYQKHVADKKLLTIDDDSI